MEEHSQEERLATEKKVAKKERIRYVQELAGPDDQWITPVDAARITGASESMANRWVTSGRLPIRGNTQTQEEELVGIPPRTRQCRLSDVARIRPILYPDLAISSAVRTLHLPSIPQEVGRLTQEHEQLLADHHRLMRRFTELLEAMDTYHVQFHKDMQYQREDLHRRVREWQETLAEQFSQAQQVLLSDLAQTQESLCTLDAYQRESVQALQIQSRELAGRMEIYREQGQQALAIQTTDQQKALLEYQQAMHVILQQSEQVIQERLNALEQGIASEIGNLARQIAMLAERMTASAAEFEATIQALNERVQSLGVQLALAQHHAGEQEQTITKHEMQLAKLEQVLAEQQTQLTRHEQLFPLSEQVEYLSRVLAERGLLPSEVQGTNDQMQEI